MKSNNSLQLTFVDSAIDSLSQAVRRPISYYAAVDR